MIFLFIFIIVAWLAILCFLSIKIRSAKRRIEIIERRISLRKKERVEFVYTIIKQVRSSAN